MTTQWRMSRVVKSKKKSSRTNSAAQNRYRSNIHKLFQNGLHCLRYRYIDQIRLKGVSSLELPLNQCNLKVHLSHQTHIHGCGGVHNTICHSDSHSGQDSWHNRRYICHYVYEISFFPCDQQYPVLTQELLRSRLSAAALPQPRSHLLPHNHRV